MGVAIRMGYIVWMHEPFPCGGWPDIAIFNSLLCQRLDAGKKVIADGGYSLQGQYTIAPRMLVTEQQRRIHGLIRARHEVVNWRMKQWKILGGKQF